MEQVGANRGVKAYWSRPPSRPCQAAQSSSLWAREASVSSLSRSGLCWSIMTLPMMVRMPAVSASWKARWVASRCTEP